MKSNQEVVNGSSDVVAEAAAVRPRPGMIVNWNGEPAIIIAVVKNLVVDLRSLGYDSVVALEVHYGEGGWSL